MKILSLPIKGLDWHTWDREDIDTWRIIIRKQSKLQPPYTDQDMADIERLRKKYKLDKYYSFA